MFKNILYENDIKKEDLNFILNKCKSISIDTETTGLNPLIDDLCLIQICAKNKIYIVKYNHNYVPMNIKKILSTDYVVKIFHHANFDLRFLMKSLKMDDINNVVCTKIAYKLLNGIHCSSSLKDLIYKYFSININKLQQTSDWSKKYLSKEQIEYAITDVIYLEDLWSKLESELNEKNLLNDAKKCFDYLPINAKLSNRGIENIFIY